MNHSPGVDGVEDGLPVGRHRRAGPVDARPQARPGARRDGLWREILCVPVGILLVVMAVGFAVRHVQLLRSHEVTTATSVDPLACGKSSCPVRVHYRTRKGAEHTADLDLPSPQAVQQFSIDPTIWYDPEHPDWISRPGDGDGLGGAVFLGLLGPAMLLFATVRLRTRNRARPAVEQPPGPSLEAS